MASRFAMAFGGGGHDYAGRSGGARGRTGWDGKQRSNGARGRMGWERGEAAAQRAKGTAAARPLAEDLTPYIAMLDHAKS